MNTRQFPNTPRTMSEAFGPYAGQDLQPMAEPRGELRTDLARTRRVDTAQMQGNHAHVVNGNTGPQQAQAGRVAVPPHWHSEQAPAHRLMPQIVDELSEGQLLAVSAGLVVSIFGLVAIVLWAVGIA